MKQTENRPFTRRHLPLILYVAGLFVVLNLPVKGVETVSNDFLDKIFHALLFVPFPALLIRSLPSRIGLLLCSLSVLLLSFGFAMATELQQTLNPYHTYDGYDILADMVGAIVGLTLYLLLRSSPRR